MAEDQSVITDLAATISALAKLAAAHPLLVSWLTLFFAMALLLGTIHESRMFGDVLIVFIKHLKRELSAGRDVLQRLKRELTTWNTDR